MAVDRPEVELLLCCARVGKDAERADRIGALLRQEIDWGYLLWVAGEHGMEPLLYRHLVDARREAVPEELLNELRNHFRANNLRNLFLTGELLKILDAFEARGVPIVPYKGPVLAASAYDNLALREFVDLDVLIRKGDIATAKELLNSLGYRQEDVLTPVQEAAFLHADCEYHFARDSVYEYMAELHWEIVPRRFSFSFDYEGLWDRLERVSLSGRTILTLSPEDSLLVLCVHGGAEFWRQLKWIRDVAGLIDVHEGMDWGRLIERADSLGGGRMLLLGLFLANDLLGTALPEKVLRRVRADPQVKALAAWVYDRLFRADDYPTEIAEEIALNTFHLRLRERPWDKVLYCVRAVATPTRRDWALLPRLPMRLWPLYYAVKPFRLIRKHGRKLFGRSPR